MNPSNNGFDIQTTDNHVVSVSCKEMISECLDGLVEVRGIAEGKNSVTCDYYILFPRELASTFGETKNAPCLYLYTKGRGKGELFI